MENRNLLNKNVYLLSATVLLAAFTRLIPHIPNFAPIGALAIFSGAFFKNKWLRFLIPLSAMFLSDIFLGFHATMPFVYGAFILSTGLGTVFLKKTFDTKKLFSVSLLSSLLFFLITNFGVWLTSSMYPKTLYGL